MKPFKPIRIGKYFLIDHIGTGGMGAVYRGKLIGVGQFAKEVAIKKIGEDLTSDADAKQLFETEATICSRLNHPNIINVFDFFHSAQGLLMAMEFVHGKNLQQITTLLSRSRELIPLPAILYLISEVCAGLEYAHSIKDETGTPLNLIHRDISPQNMMISYDGAVKIVDFGLAKTTSRPNLTQRGMIRGKLRYMAPEQAESGVLDKRTDLFSLGVVFWELLAGKRLFAAATEAQTLKKVVDCVVPPPSEINSNVDPELDEIVLTALARDPNLRFQDAKQFRQELQKYIKHRGLYFDSHQMGEFIRRLFAEESETDKVRSREILALPTPESESDDALLPKTSMVRKPSFQHWPELTLIALSVLIFCVGLYFKLSPTTNTATTSAQRTPPQADSELQPLQAQTDTKFSSRNEVLQQIKNRAKQLETGPWTERISQRNNTAHCRELLEVKSDYDSVKMVLNNISAYPLWLSGIKNGLQHQVRRGIRIIDVRFDPKTPMDLILTLEENRGQYDRPLHLSLNDDAGDLVIDMALEPSTTSTLRSSNSQWRFISQGPNSKKFYVFVESYLTLSSGFIFTIIDLATSNEGAFAAIINEVMQNLQKQALQLRQVASPTKN